MSNKHAKRTKEMQGYVKPSFRPECANCQHYRRVTLGQPATELQPAILYQPPVCLLGNFIVDPHGTCMKYVKRRTPNEPQSMNPGLLEDVPMTVHKEDRVKVPRLAAEWARY